MQSNSKECMDSCDVRTRAYKNGKTFEQCMQIAEKINQDFKKQIDTNHKILWTEILDRVNHDELVYKLSLKYLRRDGYDIGDWKTPEVKKFPTS